MVDFLDLFLTLFLNWCVSQMSQPICQLGFEERVDPGGVLPDELALPEVIKFSCILIVVIS